jgi:ribonuclease Z
MRTLLVRLLVGVVVLILIAAVALRAPAVEDALLERGLTAGFQTPPLPEPDGLRVFMCGTAAPLPTPDRAQACVAVLAGDTLLLVDAGARSANVASLAGLPLERLSRILLTHFHSDHIAAIPDFALASWVAGRPAPLEVVGPAGVEAVVEGLNTAYADDRRYRVAHHGADLLPAEFGALVARRIAPGETLSADGVTVTAFTVDHDPVRPAVGYRIEHGGRSVVVTGDTVVNEAVVEAARGADLVLADALSMTLVQTMERVARATGRERLATIFHDIQDYHADAADLGAFLAADVGTVAAYHLVPAPRNALMERVFRRDLPDGVVMTDDGMVFDLPAGSDAVRITAP